VSRGVVLWPDETTSASILSLWGELEEAGVPTLATATHRRHVPHLSLVVADDLPVAETLAAVGRVPAASIGLRLASVGVFPGGVLYLVPAAGETLVAEHHRVHAATAELTVGGWGHYEPGAWTPHVTVSTDLDEAQLAAALPLVARRLPLEGRLDRGGVEDGSTGKRWLGG
jgi:hypothetical protein